MRIMKVFIIAYRALIMTDALGAACFECSNWSAIGDSLLALRLYLGGIRLLGFDWPTERIEYG